MTTDNETAAMEDHSVVSNDYSTTLGALIMAVVFLLGVPGNLFIIWSILARIKHRSVTTILILNLACADSFILLLTILFIVYLAMQTWVYGLFMCKAVFYLCNTNMYASIFLIMLMSLHRMAVVVLPRRFSARLSRKVVIRVIVVMWLLVMAFAIPSAVFRNIREDIDDEMNIRHVCAPNHTMATHVSTPSCATVCFIFPFCRFKWFPIDWLMFSLVNISFFTQKMLKKKKKKSNCLLRYMSQITAPLQSGYFRPWT